MKWPLELAERDGKPAQRDVALRPRIAEPPGLCGQMGRDGGQEVGLVELERFAQFKPQ